MLFFMIMAILDYCHLYTNFIIILSVFSKEPTRILLRNIVESMYWFRENGYAIIIEFFNPIIWLIYAVI